MYLALLLTFLLGDGGRLLLMSGNGGEVPLLFNLPLLLTLYLFVVVVDSLCLTVLVVVASVPHAVAVVVDEGTQVVLTRHDVEEAGKTADGKLLFDRLVLAQQLYDDIGTGIDATDCNFKY